MMCITSTHMPLAKVDLWVPSPMRKEQHRGLPLILTPMRWDSVRPLASLIHVPRRLRDPVADLLLDSSEKSKGPEADWSSLEQSEIHGLESWYIPTKNISKWYVSYRPVVWCNNESLYGVVLDPALEEITAEESQVYTVRYSGPREEWLEHMSGIHRLESPAVDGPLKSPDKCLHQSASNICPSQRETRP